MGEVGHASGGRGWERVGGRVPDFTVHTAVLVTILNQQYCGNSHHTDAIILPS